VLDSPVAEKFSYFSDQILGLRLRFQPKGGVLPA
jgi:hypothetical protein